MVILFNSFPVPSQHAHLIPLIFPGAHARAHLDTLSRHVLKHLSPVPLIKSLTIHLKPMPGVAHTYGSDSQKTIVLSSLYFDQIYQRGGQTEDAKTRALQYELCGVLVHEMVHVWQYNGLGTADGGLIEGIADFVRLGADLAPAHWTQRKGGKWNDGYETTGYFLAWIEKNLAQGSGFVGRLNNTLSTRRWDPSLFMELTGRPITELWDLYQNSI